MMATSEMGRQLIMEREGCRLEAYRDTVGVWTIACGHTAGVSEGECCSREQAMAWLREDLGWAEAAVNHGAKALIAEGQLEQHQFDALVSFTFNVGQGAFFASTLLRLLNAGDPVEFVADQFDRWHIPAEITSRRNGEREQFKGAAFEARIA